MDEGKHQADCQAGKTDRSLDVCCPQNGEDEKHGEDDLGDERRRHRVLAGGV